MKKIKLVFVIDDDRVARLLAGIAIEEAALAENIIYYSNGRDALQHIKDYCVSTLNHPDRYCPELILLDMHMPGMDGYAFLEHLSSLAGLQHKNTSLILLSSAHMRTEIKHYTQFAVLGFLEKPLTGENLTTFLKARYKPFQK